MNFIDEIENDQEGLQSKLNTENTKVWTRMGSKWDKVNPTIKCEWTFKETNEPKDVFEAVKFTKDLLSIFLSIWYSTKECSGMMDQQHIKKH